MYRQIKESKIASDHLWNFQMRTWKCTGYITTLTERTFGQSCYRRHRRKAAFSARFPAEARGEAAGPAEIRPGSIDDRSGGGACSQLRVRNVGEPEPTAGQPAGPDHRGRDPSRPPAL